ncbi:DUF5675 family protein [Chryseobacterium lactis]|uniref:DUF5675 family protein n=1 Tax=Chryseobacterium lactis TaxID=1241981 RepID=UPI001626C533|nr:DUF5675 family protein [Chryseobacterium lactis]
MKSLLLTIAFAIILSTSSYAQENFELTVERKLSSDHCTMGYLIANGKAICYTLELPWKDNLNTISCIPAGTYKGVLRYDKTDRWRIQLENVPNRTGVQIHIGNYTTQTEGCILVGMDAKVNNCSVLNSSAAYAKLKEAFYGTNTPNSTPNKHISVTFK